MARQLRIQFPGALYHAYARGNARQPIFFDDHDRRLFLEELWRVCEHYDWVIWAYCLMRNHYHLLLETLKPTLSAGMRDLNGNVAQTVNRRHDRVGHLYQGRFKAKLVDDQAYLTRVSRYVVNNPVKDGLCASAADWRWSSYNDIAGRRRGAHPRLMVKATLARFNADPEIARSAYERFIAAATDDYPAPNPDNPLIIGDDEFVQRVTAGRPQPSPEVPRPETVTTPLRVFRSRAQKQAAIRDAFATRTYSQAEIARHFGVHYSTVSRILARGPLGRARAARVGTAIQDVTPDDPAAEGKLEFPHAAIQDVTPTR
jgi:putative transposase